MSVSASAVNGSSGCCSVRGYLGYPLLGHVLFCESRGSFLELLWFSWHLWSSWFFSSSHGLFGSPVLVFSVLLLAILDAVVSSLFLVVRVVLLLHSSSWLVVVFVLMVFKVLTVSRGSSVILRVRFWWPFILVPWESRQRKKPLTRFTSMQHEKNENQKKQRTTRKRDWLTLNWGTCDLIRVFNKPGISHMHWNSNVQ